MISSVTNLSTFNSIPLSTNMVGIDFKQFKRTYPGNYSLNFALCLSAYNDFKVKNYTNFYLTNNQTFNNSFNVDSSKLLADRILTDIIFGNEYLQFSKIDPTPYINQTTVYHTNLLSYSEQFNSDVWIRQHGTISANAIIAPDGTLTADKYIEGTVSPAFMYQEHIGTNETMVFSVYAKAGERHQIQLQFSSFNMYAINSQFDLSNGTITYSPTVNNDYTNSGNSITYAGNGWYRCSIWGTKGSSNNNINRPTIAIIDAELTGLSGLYLWGAQLEGGRVPTTYWPTTWKTATNLLTYSVGVDTNNGWAIGPNMARVGNTTAPDGSNTATTYSVLTAGNAYVVQQAGLAANTTYTFSVYARLNTGSVPIDGYLLIVDYDNDNNAGTWERSLGSLAGLSSAWKRFSITFTNVAAFTGNLYAAADWSNGATIDLWGAQLETGNLPTTYIPTYATSVTLDTVATVDTVATTVDYTRYITSLNYGACIFSDSPSDSTKFTIDILDNNNCQIYFTKKYKKYYLCSDNNNKLIFVKESLLNFDQSTINAQDFIYMFSENEKYILFFQNKSDGDYFLSKNNNALDLIKVTSDNILTNINNPFKLTRSLYNTSNISLNTSYITYDNTNNINYNKSKFDLTNNFILHKNYSDLSSNTDIIVLKNQLLKNDVFSSSNNLLSSAKTDIFVNDLRDYTNILEDIPEENTTQLELNYVYYNEVYTIKPGSNEFISPPSLYPFSQLNVNDTKFVESGAFSYPSPEYADKIYSLSDNVVNNNKEYLLCTWLSGSISSDNKVWMDRYYYPDLIEKKNALGSNPVFNITYNDMVEQLIASNMNLGNIVTNVKFFDKKSDLIFEPNKKYNYERISIENTPPISQVITRCSSFSTLHPSNYFKKINDSGMLTLGLYFDGDDSSWIVRSDRNNIDSGLTITKNGNSLDISLKLFDTSSGTFVDKNSSHSLKQLKQNFVFVSIDTFTGDGYFFLNNAVINTFNLSLGEFFKKQLLYGDFFLLYNDDKINILNPNVPILQNVLILDQFIDTNLSYILPIYNGSTNIDDIFITLPCGLKNNIDEIELLQNIGNSSTFKSNNFNINIKNLNISNPNIIKGIQDSITSSLVDNIPVTANINKINFENFK